jgi:hypothetical protein
MHADRPTRRPLTPLQGEDRRMATMENCDALMAADKLEGGDEKHSIDERRCISREHGGGGSINIWQLIFAAVA